MDSSTAPGASPQPTASTSASSAPQSQAPSRPPPNVSPSLQNSSLNTSNGSASAAPPFTQYSASTAEILKRVSANALGTQGWEAAREQVLKSMVTSDNISAPPAPGTSSKRGRGGSRGGATTTAKSEAAVGGNGASSGTPSSPAVGRGRGGGRGRGRGGGRGGKRKRANSEDASEDDNDSDVSNSYTPLPSATRSGRAVNKPTQYVPALPSPTADSAKKRRKTNRKPSEASVCKICLRGTSPNNNPIVFCDGCNTPYHQYCHDPTIPKEVVHKVEAEWNCAACVRSREATAAAAAAAQTAGELVAGEDLTADEKRAYFSTLPPATLVSLLVQAATTHPSLALFPPSAKYLTSSTAAGSNNPSVASSAPLTNQKPPDAATANPLPPPVSSSTTNAPAPPTNYTDATPLAPGAGVPASSTTTTTTTTTTQQQPQPQLPPASHTQSQAPDPTPVPATAASSSANAPSASDADAEADYEADDPPAHYPRPGTGLAASMRPEAEDMGWLVDDNLEVFQHLYREGGGGGVAEIAEDLNGPAGVR